MKHLNSSSLHFIQKYTNCNEIVPIQNGKKNALKNISTIIDFTYCTSQFSGYWWRFVIGLNHRAAAYAHS